MIATYIELMLVRYSETNIERKIKLKTNKSIYKKYSQLKN